MKLNILHNKTNRTLTGTAVQLVQNAWDALTKSCPLGYLRLVIEPYVFFNPAVTQFYVLSQRTDGFVAVKQR